MGTRRRFATVEHLCAVGSLERDLRYDDDVVVDDENSDEQFGNIIMPL